ncbi:MAG: hypothetical protein HY719_05485, partial [Planctomycetes bacterium]|nr:hypothetical protein [Planctomycetota bacterium]
IIGTLTFVRDTGAAGAVLVRFLAELTMVIVALFCLRHYWPALSVGPTSADDARASRDPPNR